MRWGKIIGVTLGFLLGGIIGAVLGLIIGHISDVVRHHPLVTYSKQLKQLFFESTFLVMGYIAKSDGHISEAEIQAARQIMQKMGLNEESRQRAMHLFVEGKNPGFALESTLAKIIQAAGGNVILLQVFVDIQIQAVHLSGAISPEKQKVLQYIFSRLGYQPFEFYRRQHASSATHNNASEAYALLGIQENASNAEVKQAYRRLMSRYHPDKLAARGLTEEVMKMATEKAQSIQLAYDHLRKIRGF